MHRLLAPKPDWRGKQGGQVGRVWNRKRGCMKYMAVQDGFLTFSWPGFIYNPDLKLAKGF
ncbi:MAG: hypothetical protein WBP45_08600 [Daejeonella sp.]